MIDLEQEVVVRWNPTTRKHFENIGYQYTKHNAEFIVHAKHLPPGSGTKVKAICDYCGEEIDIPYGVYLTQTKNHTIKCACYKCVIFKAFEYGDKRKKIYDEFINICKTFSMTPITTYEEFTVRKQLLKFICPTHGLQQETIDSLRRFHYGCRQCGYDHIADTLRTSTEELIKQCNEHGYVILNPEDYVNNETKNLLVICKDCNKRFITSRSSIMSSKGRCSYCGQVATTRTPEEAAELIASVNGNKLLNPEDYKGNQVGNLIILCGTCGEHTFTTSIGRYFSLNVNRCGYCSANMSKGEVLISEILNELGIEYVSQKRYDNCRDKSTLPFDFYLPAYNKIIEFDGQGHFEPIFGEDSFAAIQYHDKIKNKYCKDNGIDILRIPFWESNNAKSMIINFLHLNPYPLIINYNKSPYNNINK